MRLLPLVLLAGGWTAAVFLFREPLVLVGLVLFLVSLGVAWGAISLLERMAPDTILDHPGGRKDHTAPVPLVGGIAVLLAVALPSVGGLFLALTLDRFGTPGLEGLEVHLPGIRSRALQLLTILGGSGILLVLGHVDDRRGLSPWTRLAVQALCAALLVVVGLRITLHLPIPWLHGVLTILLVVFVTNAVNFIDNMNGLMAGTVLVGTLHLLVLATATGQLFMAAILICLAGGLVAFLPWNYPSARIFMGDAGSLAVGFLLSALTVAFTFEGERPSLRPVVLPLLVLLVPLADGVTVVVCRLRRGVHPFTAGNDHLSHRLASRGIAPRTVVPLFWLAAFVAGLPVGLVADVPTAPAAVIWTSTLLILAAFLHRPQGPPGPRSPGRPPP